VTFSEQKQAMTDVGVPERIADMSTHALTLFAQGDSDWITDGAPSILGRPARTFEQFVTDHAASPLVTLKQVLARTPPASSRTCPMIARISP
jgi:hypothetical protein